MLATNPSNVEFFFIALAAVAMAAFFMTAGRRVRTRTAPAKQPLATAPQAAPTPDRICDCPDPQPDDYFKLIGLAEPVYLHRYCGRMAPDDFMTPESIKKIDIIADYMKEERRDISDELRPWFDRTVPREGESPIIAALLALKAQVVEGNERESGFKKEIDKLRTLLWGRTCVYCEVKESATSRVPDGRPICTDCKKAGAWEDEQAQLALDDAIKDVV